MALAGFSGCSTDVEVETQTTSSRPKVLTSERTKTAVAVDLLRDQRRVLMEDGRALEVPFESTMVVRGCVHFHEHLHVYLVEGDRKSERAAIEIVRQWSKGTGVSND